MFLSLQFGFFVHCLIFQRMKGALLHKQTAAIIIRLLFAAGTGQERNTVVVSSKRWHTTSCLAICVAAAVWLRNKWFVMNVDAYEWCWVDGIGSWGQSSVCLQSRFSKGNPSYSHTKMCIDRSLHAHPILACQPACTANADGTMVYY